MSDTSTITNTTTKIKVPKLWKVVLKNDDYTPVDFVIQILMQIYNKPSEEAIALTMAVHEKGSAIIGLYTKEIALTKVEQTIKTAERYQHPLLAVAEEA